MEDGTFVAFCHFLADVFSLFSLLLQRNYYPTSGEGATESATAKAVRCFNIFNHDSWPEDQDELVDHGADDLTFLLDHFSHILTR
ncbi:hypothetical protein N1851_020034 [Merluccius polli]|uniref:Uncharacterized protein n=1 Tax=Merluccius polli TaxID=89951 RepID=A0AA47MLJ6_MERPO|nr:hypothetical protein N1851_020034 [Merluccius polli]